MKNFKKRELVKKGPGPNLTCKKVPGPKLTNSRDYAYCIGCDHYCAFDISRNIHNDANRR